MLEILKLANDINYFDKFRTNPSNLQYSKQIYLIDEICSSGVRMKARPIKKIIALANRISNLEPSIVLTSGDVIHLDEIRKRSEYSPSELDFVASKIVSLMHDILDAPDGDIIRATKHLLTGEEVISDIKTTKIILYHSLCFRDTITQLTVLIGYARALGLANVKELANLFCFHYCDREADAKANGVICYINEGAQYKVVCS